MKKIIFIIALITIFTRLAFATDIGIMDMNRSNNNLDYVEGEIVVKFKNTAKPDEIEDIHSFMGTKTTYTSPYSNIRKVQIPEGLDEFKALEQFRNNPSVDYAHLNYICQAHFVPNDPLYLYQWNFTLINMESVWDIQPSGLDDIVVAVLDTGVAYEDYSDDSGDYVRVPDLENVSFVNPYDFIGNDSHANDDSGHGTHVTGTICQSTNNGYGVAGIAHGVSIMPVKVLNSNGNGNSIQLAEGIIWAVNHGAHIISMSLGFSIDVTPETIPLVTMAIEYASLFGVVLVSSTGNEGVDIVSYPAAYPEVISVGAVHSGDDITDYSQYGANLELVAPGGDEEDRNGDRVMDGILQQTIWDTNYSKIDFFFYIGTSMAVPHVSGLIALLLTQNPYRTIIDIRTILHSTSIDLGISGWDEYYGYGRIDAYRALNYDKDGDGFIAEEDCDDTNPDVYPGAIEICGNGIDDDCDGEVDCDQDRESRKSVTTKLCFISLF